MYYEGTNHFDSETWEFLRDKEWKKAKKKTEEIRKVITVTTYSEDNTCDWLIVDGYFVD